MTRGVGELRLVGLEKAYDGVPAVRGIDLEIGAGEFFSLLGPSGCGKTTTLRMIGGFEEPTGGRIVLDGAELAAVPAHKRPVNTVFQSYALFPFLDVWDNVAFGLRYQKVTKVQKAQRVGEILDLVRMGDFAQRRPAALSGGQQQRVALARALVLNPVVLLLDEPLGALDAQLRKHLQLELKTVQESVGITFVYVTHDQEEALTMSDRIAVMRDGRVEQVGPPREIYSSPASAYVASFLGSANVLDVEVLGPDGPDVMVRSGALTMRVEADSRAVLVGRGKVVVRPERLVLRPGGGGEPGANSVTGLVDRIVYLGPATHVVVRLSDGQTLLAAMPNTGATALALDTGSAVEITVPRDAARLLPGDDEPDESAPAANADVAADEKILLRE
ncbi:MAG: spermidine/putrescine transport system ATP-binding protein [Actinomycetota bacterium]|nr:spermidine/putrescine transport system ATP-binding protein [Actinomycetota bacterium]